MHKKMRHIVMTQIYITLEHKNMYIILMMITTGRKIGKVLVLAPLPLAIAYVEVNLQWVGYSLVSVWWDLNKKCILKQKKQNIFTPLRQIARQTYKRFKLVHLH